MAEIEPKNTLHCLRLLQDVSKNIGFKNLLTPTKKN